MQAMNMAPGGWLTRQARRAGGLPLRGADLLLTWLERRRERRLLDRVSDHLLKDIGLSRAEVDREARKAFWRA